MEYSGEVKYEGSSVPHGRGTQIFPRGEVYSGDFLEGAFEGQGRYESRMLGWLQRVAELNM